MSDGLTCLNLCPNQVRIFTKVYFLSFLYHIFMDVRFRNEFTYVNLISCGTDIPA